MNMFYLYEGEGEGQRRAEEAGAGGAGDSNLDALPSPFGVSNGYGHFSNGATVTLRRCMCIASPRETRERVASVTGPAAR